MTGERLLRADAVLHALLGVLLLLAPWNALYRALDLPQPTPEIYTQAFGIVVLGLAYLRWLAPREDATARAVAAGGVIGNLGSATVLAAWLVFGDAGTDTRGTAVLGVTIAALVALGVAEARIAIGRLAFVLPRD